MSNFRRSLMEGGEQPVFVDWIEIPSGVYIDTRIIPNEDLFFSIDFKVMQFSNSNNAILFYSGNIADNAFGVAVFKSTDTYFYYGAYHNNGGNFFILNKFNNIRIDYYQNKWCTVVNGNPDTRTQFSLTPFQGTKSLWVNVANPYSIVDSATVRYKHIIFSKRNSEQIRNFNPCFYNGQYGLWDTINNKFYGKSGGIGTIIGGYDD